MKNGELAGWFQAKVDVCELAKLRKVGWTLKKIVAHADIAKSSVIRGLRFVDEAQQGFEVISHGKV